VKQYRHRRQARRFRALQFVVELRRRGHDEPVGIARDGLEIYFARVQEIAAAVALIENAGDGADIARPGADQLPTALARTRTREVTRLHRRQMNQRATQRFGDGNVQCRCDRLGRR